MHTMTLDEFKKSLSQPRVPADLPSILEALWHDGKGDWHKAHELAQDVPDPDGAWVHAFLHRKKETPATLRIGTAGRGSQSAATRWTRNGNRLSARS
jgi:hypothetical protein